MWQYFLKDGLSLVVLDNAGDNEVDSCDVVGVSLNLDASTEVTGLENCELPESVVRINDDVENPVKNALLQNGGKWVDFKFVAVSNSVGNQQERTNILNLMENELIKLAKSMSYSGIITVSSHVATQEIEEKIYGYDVRNVLHVSSYTMQNSDGENIQPFKHAPADYSLKCLVKLIT